jgi:hypothetical protein
MVKKKNKSRKKISNRRKNTLRRKLVRKKISNRRKNTLRRKLVCKKLLDITYIFKNLYIDPLENILSSIKITNRQPIIEINRHVHHPITNITPFSISQRWDNGHN